MSKVLLSAIIAFGLLVPLAPTATAQTKQDEFQIAARRPQANVREQEPKLCLTENQVLFKVGQQHPDLLELVKSCDGNPECIVGKFKAYQKAKSEDRNLYMMFSMLQQFLPTMRDMAGKQIDEAARRSDAERAGKLLVAKQNLDPLIELFKDLANGYRQSSQSDD